LAPGLYRVTYQTDATHAYDDWVANPPYDPEGWGLSLTAHATDLAAQAFDVWNDRDPVVALIGMRNDEFRAVTFSVAELARVIVYGLGEMKSSDRYDYGWIERFGSGDPLAGRTEDEDDRRPLADATIWEMKYDDSRPAGGDRSNRRIIDFVDLPPSTYTLYYRTDDSQAYESWSNGEPENGERWGIALFPLDEAQAGAIQVLNRASWSSDEKTTREHDLEVSVEVAVSEEEVALEPLEVDDGEILVALNRLENNQQVAKTFHLSETTRLRIVAVGEITLSGERYDYGRIEQAGSGKTVWEMTWENTRSAGGDDSNRIFDGQFELPAGEYIVRFTTDGTHAYNHFDTRPPAIPEAWGITVAYAQ